LPLSALIDIFQDKSQISKIFGSFSCSQNKDVEEFFKQQCLDFEERDKSRTYLIIDQDELEQK
jgi:arsenate reductase-like glutaredoxin family protein